MKEKNLIVKLSGDKELINRIIAYIKRNYNVVRLSSLLVNDDGSGYHILATLEEPEQ